MRRLITPVTRAIFIGLTASSVLWVIVLLVDSYERSEEPLVGQVASIIALSTALMYLLRVARYDDLSALKPDVWVAISLGVSCYLLVVDANGKLLDPGVPILLVFVYGFCTLGVALIMFLRD